MRIIVLAGGLSPERDVSLSSGSLIANALIENGHDVMLLDLFLGNDNKEILPVYRNKNSKYRFNYIVPEHEPDLTAIKSSVISNNDFIGNGVIDLCKDADVVFLGLHGSIGENGQLQAVFDMYGINYTGTKYIGSLLAMDKDISKNGRPICAAGFECIRDGFEKARNQHKFRCPFAFEKENSCPLKDKCTKSKYGRVFQIKVENDLRLFGVIQYNSQKWKIIYKDRTSCERMNNRILNDYKFKDCYMHGESRTFSIFLKIALHSIFFAHFFVCLLF